MGEELDRWEMPPALVSTLERTWEHAVTGEPSPRTIPTLPSRCGDSENMEESENTSMMSSVTTAGSIACKPPHSASNWDFWMNVMKCGGGTPRATAHSSRTPLAS